LKQGWDGVQDTLGPRTSKLTVGTSASSGVRARLSWGQEMHPRWDFSFKTCTK